MNQTIKCAVAFTRVACAEQGNNSIQKQRQRILDYAEQRGIQIDTFIEAIGSPGSAPAGKQMERLIEFLQQGDTLIITELSRLSRSLIELSRIMDILKNKKINLLMASLDKNDEHQLPFGFNGEEEASKVKFCYEKIIEGWSFSKIAQHLNASE